MTTDQLAGFFLTEEIPTPPADSFPLDRRPIDPGFLLTWKEFPADCHPLNRSGHTVRAGMVLAPAPRPGSLWVVPDEPAPGEGYAVIVRDVTADDATKAIRVVGAGDDYRSTVGWQRPRSLPRAVLRVDLCDTGGEGGGYPVRRLHADPHCGSPRAFLDEDVTRGVPQVLDECYVFNGRLHPMSRPPIDPVVVVEGLSRYVQPCGVCLDRPTHRRDRAPKPR